MCNFWLKLNSWHIEDIIITFLGARWTSQISTAICKCRCSKPIRKWQRNLNRLACRQMLNRRMLIWMFKVIWTDKRMENFCSRRELTTLITINQAKITWWVPWMLLVIRQNSRLILKVNTFSKHKIKDGCHNTSPYWIPLKMMLDHSFSPRIRLLIKWVFKARLTKCGTSQ